MHQSVKNKKKKSFLAQDPKGKSFKGNRNKNDMSPINSRCNIHKSFKDGSE